MFVFDSDMLFYSMFLLSSELMKCFMRHLMINFHHVLFVDPYVKSTTSIYFCRWCTCCNISILMCVRLLKNICLWKLEGHICNACVRKACSIWLLYANVMPHSRSISESVQNAIRRTYWMIDLDGSSEVLLFSH